MNYGSHLLVAQEVKPLAKEAFLFSTMAPDFAKMAGTRLKRGMFKRHRARGVDFHYATDNAFHTLPLFIELKAEARKELRSHVRDHAADGYSHMVTELLLDGVVFEHREAAHDLDRVLAWALDHMAAIGDMAEDSKSFAAVILDRAEAGAPLTYRDAEAVANIIHRWVNSGRYPKLEMDEQHLPILTEALAKQRQRLLSCGHQIIEATVRALK